MLLTGCFKCLMTEAVTPMDTHTSLTTASHWFLCSVHPEVQSGTAGRAEPPDWLEQAPDPTPSSLKEPGAVVMAAPPVDNRAPSSPPPVSQSASAISVTSFGPPTLLLRETLGRNIDAPLHQLLLPPPPHLLASRLRRAAGGRRRERRSVVMKRRRRQENCDCCDLVQVRLRKRTLFCPGFSLPGGSSCPQLHLITTLSHQVISVCDLISIFIKLTFNFF